MTARVLKTDPFIWAMLEMEQAASRAGFLESDFRRLAGNEDMLRQMLQVARGHAEVKLVERVIDLDADPFAPNNWKVEKHQHGGSFKWDPKQVQFYLSEPQRKEKSIEGNKLHKELEGKPVFNANLLDYLLAHPNLIPEEWKQDEKGRTRYIFFWGTIYRGSGDATCMCVASTGAAAGGAGASTGSAAAGTSSALRPCAQVRHFGLGTLRPSRTLGPLSFGFLPVFWHYAEARGFLF
jgi:hypothetical protein